MKLSRFILMFVFFSMFSCRCFLKIFFVYLRMVVVCSNVWDVRIEGLRCMYVRWYEARMNFQKLLLDSKWNDWIIWPVMLWMENRLVRTQNRRFTKVRICWLINIKMCFLLFYLFCFILQICFTICIVCSVPAPVYVHISVWWFVVHVNFDVSV